MSGEMVSFMGLAATILVHLISTVWWAASITRRIDHVERWIAHHEHTAERLAALEQQIEHVSHGIQRIEQFLRAKY